MSPLTKLRVKAGDSAEHAEMRGMWFNIRVMPDLATGELLNIGVGFVGQDHRLHARLLDRFEAFDCLYRNRLSAENVRFLVQMVGASLPRELAAGALPLTPSANVVFSPLKFTSGDSVNTILDELYHETVTMAHVAVKEEVEEKPESLDTSKARKLVFEALFRLNPMAMRIVADNPLWSVSDMEGERPMLLDMPLRGIHRFGNVLSAWYKKPTLELTMLRAEVDMDIASRLFPRDHGGLFILRPPMGQKGFREEHHRQIDNVIDDLNWRTKIHCRDFDLRFEVEDSEERLAGHIQEWATA